MKIIKIILSCLILTSISCSEKSQIKKYTLKKTEKKLSFVLDSDTKNELRVYSIYKEKEGKEYFTFQNPNTNTILFYNLQKQNLEFKVNFPIDGNNGIGFANGYYIHNLDSIYVPNRDIKEISLVNKNGTLITKYSYDKDVAPENLSIFSISASYQKQAEVIGRTMYLYSGPNRFNDHDPVSIKFNMDSYDISALPFDYPEYPGSDNKLKKFGLETAFSRCFDGKHFIYSFYYDENIYIASIEHDSIKKIPIKSKYFDKVILPGELTATPQDFCENPWYGNLLYDKYRNIYYRISYPKESIDKNIRPGELLSYGRKNFSIIILDKNFNKIGETLFPDFTYNSRIMIILKDGLYISDSHYLNPKFSDDILSFQHFKLTEL